jgi:hypothetical protein
MHYSYKIGSFLLTASMSNSFGTFSSILMHLSLIMTSVDPPEPPAILGSKLRIKSHCL